MLRKISFFIILIMLLLSCRGRQRNGRSEAGSESLTGDAVISEQSMLEIIENLSSPVEMAAFVKSMGVSFSDRYLSDLDLINNPSPSTKMSYLLGILFADLGYLNVYEKTGISVEYLTCINRLTDSLKLNQFFDYSTLKNLATNSDDLDSLMFLTIHSFNQMDAYLRQNEQNDLSILMMAGTWIESMYLGTQIAKIKPSRTLSEYIGEQKQMLNNLLVILRNYEDNINLNWLINDFELIKSEFDKVKISYIIGEPFAVEKDGTLTVVQQETSLVEISDDILQRIIDSTENIRNKHLSM